MEFCSPSVRNCMGLVFLEAKVSNKLVNSLFRIRLLTFTFPDPKMFFNVLQTFAHIPIYTQKYTPQGGHGGKRIRRPHRYHSVIRIRPSPSLYPRMGGPIFPGGFRPPGPPGPAPPRSNVYELMQHDTS